MPKSTRIIQRRTRRRQKNHSAPKTFRLIGFVLLFLIVGGSFLSLTAVIGTATLYTFFTQDLPQFEQIKQANLLKNPGETTKIYTWADGEQQPILIYEFSDPLNGSRSWQAFNQIPQHLIEATVAAEEAAFWTNQAEGSSLLRKLVSQNQRPEIPPSITEQLIAREILPAPSEQQRLQMILLTHEAANNYTKEQILEWYLNGRFYGNLAYGIEAAAQVYFNKPVSELTLAESAMLAAIPQPPTINPINQPAAAKLRQEQLLDKMTTLGIISKETAVSTKAFPLNLATGFDNQFGIIAPHFARMVQSELEQMLSREQLLGGGLSVYTTLDLQMQQQAECVSLAHINQLSGQTGSPLPADALASCPALDFLPSLNQSNIDIGDHHVDNTAVIMLDPQTGQIKALVGSLNYWDSQINGATNQAVDGLHQPGTAIFPFIALTALSKGYNTATMLLDIETAFGTDSNDIPFNLYNEDDQYHGPLSLRHALGNGYSVPMAQLMSWLGANAVVSTAHSMGIDGLRQQNHSLQLAIDEGQLSLLDMAFAYAVMDNLGVMIGQPRPERQQQEGFRTIDPITILRVENGDGELLYNFTQPQQREILTPQLAFLMNDLLADRSARCDGIGCPNLFELPSNRPTAVNAGHSADLQDAWTIGYTPQLVTAVWVGNSDNTPMQAISDTNAAAPIWHALMAWALQEIEIEGWKRPSNITEIPVCTPSGLLPTPHCPTISELFIAGTEPAVTDNMYQPFNINRETGRLATIHTPPELIETAVYQLYPSAAASWVVENNLPQPPTEYDTVTASGISQDVAILAPQNFAYAKGQLEIIGTAQSDNFSFYRLAYFKGLQPTNIQILADNKTVPQQESTLAVWDVSQLSGLYTLLLTVFNEDGSFSESASHITIDNTQPTAEITFPLPNQQLFTDEEWIIIRTQAEDNLRIDQVHFYADDKETPFATSDTAPFTERWPILEPGCHTFTIVAVDMAGNESENTAVSLCLIERPVDQ